jgi:hypothetical protein
MGRKLVIALIGSVLLLGSTVMQAGAASAQVVSCDLSADELAGFPVITLQHDLSCFGSKALPDAVDGAFWLNLNGHTVFMGDGDIDGTTPAVISNGTLLANSGVHHIDHAVLWKVSTYDAGLPFEPAHPAIDYRGPAIVDSYISGTTLTVEPSGHSIVLQRNQFLSDGVTIADDATTGQPVAPLTVDLQNNVTDNTGIVVRADTIASGQIANNFFFYGPTLQVQAGAVQQLTVAGNVALWATGPAISITGAGAGGVTDGGGNRDIWNLATGLGVPNCVGIVCSPS